MRKRNKNLLLASSLFFLVSYLVFVDNAKADRVIEMVITVVSKIQQLA